MTNPKDTLPAQPLPGDPRQPRQAIRTHVRVGQPCCTARRGPARVAVALRLVVAHLGGKRRQAGPLDLPGQHGRPLHSSHRPGLRPAPRGLHGGPGWAVLGVYPTLSRTGSAGLLQPLSFQVLGSVTFPSHRHVTGSQAHLPHIRREQPS